MIAVDWGTSTLRGAWLDARGAVREERSAPQGILCVPPDRFGDVFRSTFGDWMAQPGEVALLAGMVGSRQGWREAPYCPCPAGLEAIARALTWIDSGRIAIVPGLACELPDGPGDTPRATRPEVLRGEETQVLGALALLGLQDAEFVLPGTHSKWVRVRAGCIASFATCMTGEVYALLRKHSILARTLPPEDPPPDEAAFRRGVALALQGGGLLHHAFSVRTLALMDRMAGDSLPDYLSGLAIGEELRDRAPASTAPLVLVGAPALTRRYALALEVAGRGCTVAPDGVAWAGLWRIAQHLRLTA